MSDIKHTNDGACKKCMEIIFTYADPYEPLVEWFVETQKQLPELHCSEVGREQVRQDRLFTARRSNAKWGESAHNWNCAMDLFKNDRKNIYDEEWFRGSFSKFIPPWICWYGALNSKFYELPHIEPRDWEKLKEQGKLKLVTKIGAWNP